MTSLKVSIVMMIAMKIEALVCYLFEIEADRAETIVATNHSTHWILHPAIEEVAFATCQRLHEGTHDIPSRRTQSLWTLTVNGNPLLAKTDIASVLNRVLILRHEVFIDGLAHSSNADGEHR